MSAPTFTAEQFVQLLEVVRQGAAARTVVETQTPPAAPQRPLSELSQSELSHGLLESMRQTYGLRSPGWRRTPGFFE